MAFPTTSVLDDFNRANENPLANGNWGGSTSIFGGPSTAILKVVSNQAKGNAPVTNSSYWSATTFGPSCEAYVTVATFAGEVCGVYFRLANIGSSVNGYKVEADVTGGTIKAYRIDAGVSTLLGASIAQAWANGDAIGASMTGDTITLYYKAAAGTWGAVGTRTDSTYSAAGNIGAGTGGTNTILDDFGGGGVVVSADEADAARSITTRRCLPPPRGDARMFVGTFETTLFAFTGDTDPRGAIAKPMPVPPRGQSIALVGKLYDAGNQQEQESGWVGATARPMPVVPYQQPQTRVMRPPQLPPDPAADISAAWSIRTATAYRPFRRLRPSLVSFVPDMQGPIIPHGWVGATPARVWPPIPSRIVGTIDAPLPSGAWWLNVRTRNVVPAPVVPSRVAYLSPTEDFTARFTSSGRTVWPIVGRASRTFMPTERPVDPLPATILARMNPWSVPRRDSRAVAVLERPEELTLDWLQPTAVRFLRPGRVWWPQTRLYWCPQTINRNRPDDRDGTGGAGRNRSVSGASGRAKTGTGNPTQ